jgi:hypothetical protein
MAVANLESRQTGLSVARCAPSFPQLNTDTLPALARATGGDPASHLQRACLWVGE